MLNKNQKALSSSELIINDDGSIYHLHLLPEDIADVIITVGDQNRATRIANFFDEVELHKSKREFNTFTGRYRGKRITAISTGIGPDNIDIVFNELDALANIDFKTRQINKALKQLTIIRVGTSGGLQPDVGVDSFVASKYGIGFDGLLNYYEHTLSADEQELLANLPKPLPNMPLYTGTADDHLISVFNEDIGFKQGITATCQGFYGPQGRRLRLAPKRADLLDVYFPFTHNNFKVTNLEMETAAMYALAKLMGHRTISLNVILANRYHQKFSATPKESVDKLIKLTLDTIVDNNL